MTGAAGGGTTDEERQRIRGYLRAQAARLSPVEIVGKVRAAMAELAAAAAAVPADRLGERPAPGEWSANEVLAHVLAADRYFGGGIASVLADRPLPAPGAGPRAEAGATPEGVPLRRAAEWLADLARAREALFAAVLAADPASHLDRTIEHPMFGPLDWRETLLFTRLHDLDHAGQLAKIAAALVRGAGAA